MAINPHDAFRQGTSQNVSYAAAGGASAQSAAFGSQTYWIRVTAVGVVSGTQDGVRIKVGDNPTASSTTTLLPLNWIEWIRCTPGQKIAVLGNNTGTGTVNITELSD
jgi:hypothetical protein